MNSRVTEVNRVYHIDRGYESIDDKLNQFSARLERVKVRAAGTIFSPSLLPRRISHMVLSAHAVMHG